MQAQVAEESIGVNEAKRDLEKIVQRVAENNDEVTIEIDGEPKAIVIPVALYQQIQRERQRAREQAGRIMHEAAERANMEPEEAEALAAEAVRWARDNKEC
jgi:prevent-host-death family protein